MRSRIISATKRPASRGGPSNVGLIQNRCRRLYVPIGPDNAADYACLPRGERFTFAMFIGARAPSARDAGAFRARGDYSRALIAVSVCQDDSGTCRCPLVSELMQSSSMKGPIAPLFLDAGKLWPRRAPRAIVNGANARRAARYLYEESDAPLRCGRYLLSGIRGGCEPRCCSDNNAS